MKTHKELCLEAWKKTGERYRNVTEENVRTFFISKYCHMCQYVDVIKSYDCYGCPMVGPWGHRYGCTVFKTYMLASVAHGDLLHYNIDIHSLRETFKNRAEFFEKTLPILESLPEPCFDPKNKYYFKELDRNW